MTAQPTWPPSPGAVVHQRPASSTKFQDRAGEGAPPCFSRSVIAGFAAAITDLLARGEVLEMTIEVRSVESVKSTQEPDS